WPRTERPSRRSRTCTQLMVLAQGVEPLNLGIKRRSNFLARKRHELSGRASEIRWSDAFVSQRVPMCHGVLWVSCQTAVTPAELAQGRRGPGMVAWSVSRRIYGRRTGLCTSTWRGARYRSGQLSDVTQSHGAGNRFSVLAAGGR